MQTLLLSVVLLGAAWLPCANGSGCYLSSISPSLSQLSGCNSTVTISGSWQRSYQLYANEKLLTSMLVAGSLVVVLPSVSEAEIVSISSPSCFGAVLFQYYDTSLYRVYPSTTIIRSSGGSSITLYFDGLELIDWSSAMLRLTKTSRECIGQTVTLDGTYEGNSSVFFRGNNLLNDTLCGEGQALASYTMNGVQFESAALVVTIVQDNTYRALFVYYGSTTDFGWTYACNLGRLAVTNTFGISVDAPYVEDIPEGDVDALRAVIEDNLPLDLVMLTSSGYFSPMYTLSNEYPNTQFVITAQDALSTTPTISNVNTLWATLHEARYLAGVVGGGMISTNGTICYIKAFDQPEVISGVNAFMLGVQKSNPYAKVHTVTINTWGDADMEQEAAKHFFANPNCELQAQHTDSFDPQEVFTNGKRYAIGSNADSRVFIGERVVTSPIFYWNNIYPHVIQKGIDGTLGAKTLVYRLYDGAVGVASASGYVSTETRETMATELAAIEAKKGCEYVFCGPLYDIEGSLQVPSGECVTNEQLGSLNWSVTGVIDLGNLEYGFAHDYQYLSPTQRVWCIALGVIGISIAVAYTILLYVWRHSTIIKFSQRRFLHLLLLGSMIALSSDVAVAFDPTLFTCRFAMWTFHIGFFITFSSLFAKAWRVWIIASQPSIQRLEVGDGLLFKIISVSVLLCALYLTLWTVIDGPKLSRLACTTTWTSVGSSYVSCTLECTAPVAWLAPLLGVEVCVLIYGATIALRLWQVHDVFSESRWLVLAVYNMAFQIAYVILLRYFLPHGSASFTIALVVTTFLAYVVLMNVIMIPKIVEVLAGRTITVKDFSIQQVDVISTPVDQIGRRRLALTGSAHGSQAMLVVPRPLQDIASSGSGKKSSKPDRNRSSSHHSAPVWDIEVDPQTSQSHIQTNPHTHTKSSPLTDTSTPSPTPSS